MNENSFSLKPSVGRPKGAKTGTTSKPQTLAAFVHNALSAPIELKDVPARPKKKSGNGIWGRFKTPEERQAYALELAAKRKASGKKPTVTRQGVPHGWTREKAEAARALAEIEADEMVAKLKASGAIAKGDTEAAKTTRDALVTLRSPGGAHRRRALATKVLLHYYPELHSRKRELVVKEEGHGCLVSTSHALNQGGYLSQNYKGADGTVKRTSAHRVAFMEKHGLNVLPEGFEVDHTCENPACINPNHLQLLSKEAHAKLTVERRLESKEDTAMVFWYLTSCPPAELARRFNAKRATVNEWLERWKAWGIVPKPPLAAEAA